MASGFIGNEVPRMGLRVRVPCPPLLGVCIPKQLTPLAQLLVAFFCFYAAFVFGSKDSIAAITSATFRLSRASG